MSDMETRQERIRLETLRHHITGSVRIPRDGYRSRVSDFLNASEHQFVVLTNATVKPLDGEGSERHAFLVVSRAHIVYLVSDEVEPG